MTDITPQPLGPTQRGLTWAWICREIAAGRLPEGTTPDNAPADALEAYSHLSDQTKETP